MEQLNGKVVAITGATAGIGRAAARALVDAGAHVALAGRRTERLEELEAELGDAVLGVSVDVRSAADMNRFIDQAVARFGRLDAVVPNAGIGAYGGIMDLTDEQLVDMIETNVNGTVWAVRAAVPHFRRHGGGDIVIVASVAGLRGAGDEAVYAATKFAQVGLAGGLDRELHGENIKTTVIAPGGVATEFAMGTGRTEDMPGLANMLRAEDVAHAIVTVLSQPPTVRTLLWSMRHITEAD